jgi:predicted metal-binding protein
MLKKLLVFIESLISFTNSSSKNPNSVAQHTLFVCKSCHRSSEERPKNKPVDGTILLDKINSLCKEKVPSEQLEIKPVECLWACSQGCVVSVSSQDKPTYLFVNLPSEDSAAALLEFMQLYIKSRKGAVAWKRLPELLQPAVFAQIPPVVVNQNSEIH